MQQLLFPDINFTCNGSITKWIVGGHDTTNNPPKLTELQIWRNTEGTSYSKINCFSPLSHSTLNGNVAEYNLSAPLEFKEGDILGLYQPQRQKSALILYFQEYDGPANYEEGPNPRSSVSLSGSPESYHYPLVTVEISIGKPVECL